MDYFKQRRAYRNYKMYEEDVSMGQNDLYRELLDYANDNGKSFDFFALKNSALLSLTGLSETGFKSARNKLVQMNLIEYKPGKKQTTKPKYRIVKLYEEYPKKSQVKDLSKVVVETQAETITKSQEETSAKTQAESHKYLLKQDNNKTNTKKDKEKDLTPYGEIIEYLNEKANKNFRSSSRANKNAIKARFNDGYKLSDFKTVIDNMTSRWLNDAKMNEFLRPSTLFGNKFDNYLNAKPVSSGVSGVFGNAEEYMAQRGGPDF